VIIRFDEVGDFKAYYAACDWCKKNGVSYGSMQRDDPIGLMRGDYDISKWRNMTKKEQESLDGQMNGDKRNGPVTITINEAPK
jgi:hypothetical protein